MQDEKSRAREAVEFRRRAEEFLQKMTEAPPSPSEAEPQKLLHELQVHQIELEMQNAELLHARDDLETALERYTDLYDFAPVGYFTIDPIAVIRDLNLTGAALLGIERSRLIGRRFESFVSEEGRPAFTAFLEKLIESRERKTCEAAITQNGGRLFHVQIQGTAAESGEEARLAVMDISERKRMEAKLEGLHAALAARAAELETANIELEAFNSSVSHDLRRPLGNINGYCQILQQFCAGKLDEQCSGYLRSIYEATLTMTGLIETLLNFSRILRIKVHRDRVDLSVMAQVVAASLKKGEPDRRVDFRAAEGITVNGDASLLEIVLSNLIGNAWKYSGKRDEAVIEFGVAEREGKPAYFIRDNGCGFDMADAGQLFAPFQRLHDGEFQGHGIGLATVERIIRRHGGRIWAESEPGKGATFYFTLEAEGIPPSIGAAANGPGRSCARIGRYR